MHWSGVRFAANGQAACDGLTTPLSAMALENPVHHDEHHVGRRLMTTILGAVPFLSLAAWHWPHGPSADYGDYAQYLLHAEALLKGRAYGDIGYIYTNWAPFIGPPVQPPGLPVALVPLLALTNAARESGLYKGFMILCVLGFLSATGAYLARFGSRLLVIATLFVVGLWVETLFATTALQPDVVFAALVWLTFLVVDRPGEWTWTQVLLISALGLLALTFRLAALTLLPAVALYAVVHRRKVGVLASAPVLVWCLCGVIALAASPGALAYARFLPHDPMQLVGAFVENVRLYPRIVLNLFLYPLPWNWGNDAYHLVICVFAVLGAVVWVPRVRHSFLFVFTVVYLGMLFVMPIRHERYLMPLAPVAVFFAMAGLAMAARWLARLTHRELADAGAARVALGVAGLIVTVALVHEFAAPRPPALMDAPGAREVFERLGAARDSGTVRAVFINPRVLTWQTGVPAMGFFTASPDSTIAEFRAKRITHVVLGDFNLDPWRSRSMASAVSTHPRAFHQLFAAGVFTVYAFDSTQASP